MSLCSGRHLETRPDLEGDLCVVGLADPARPVLAGEDCLLDASEDQQPLIKRHAEELRDQQSC